jgi:glycosyltransferase involved in cell wall biosynthesis
VAPKPPSRPVIEFAVATTDWSRSIVDEGFRLAMGGAGWIRFGQCVRFSMNRMMIGELLSSGQRLGVRLRGGDHASFPQTIFLQRHMEQKVINAVKQAINVGQFVINDVDDWFWGLHDENQAKDLVDPFKNPTSNIDHYKKILEASSLVTVSTPFLLEQMQEWGFPCRLVENSVSFHMFGMRRPRTGRPIVGWAGSTAHRSGDLQILQKPFDALKKLVRFHHTGHNSSYPWFADVVQLSRSDVSVSPMVGPTEYPKSLLFDIGVVPLSKHEFNDAKSWIKGLEYAAAGIPFIASPAREYVRLCKEYGIGRIARTHKEWVAHVEELSDPDIRQQEAQRQRAIIETHFDVKKMSRKWDEIARTPFSAA